MKSLPEEIYKSYEYTTEVENTEKKAVKGDKWTRQAHKNISSRTSPSWPDMLFQVMLRTFYLSTFIMLFLALFSENLYICPPEVREEYFKRLCSRENFLNKNFCFTDFETSSYTGQSKTTESLQFSNLSLPEFAVHKNYPCTVKTNIASIEHRNKISYSIHTKKNIQQSLSIHQSEKNFSQNHQFHQHSN